MPKLGGKRNAPAWERAFDHPEQDRGYARGRRLAAAGGKVFVVAALVGGLAIALAVASPDVEGDSGLSWQMSGGQAIGFVGFLVSVFVGGLGLACVALGWIWAWCRAPRNGAPPGEFGGPGAGSGRQPRDTVRFAVALALLAAPILAGAAASAIIEADDTPGGEGLPGAAPFSHAANPVFAADGTRIFFTNTRTDDSAHLGVYSVDLDGTDRIRVAGLPASARELTLSPDGTKVAYAAENEGSMQVFVKNVDGTVPTRLSVAGGASPAFSPDGTKIAFTGPRAGAGTDVFVTNTDGTGLQRLTADPATDAEPAFSPDGRRIAFASNRIDADRFDVYVMNADGTGEKRLHNSGEGREASFSPDGARLVFINRTDVYLTGADGAGRSRLTTFGSALELPTEPVR